MPTRRTGGPRHTRGGSRKYAPAQTPPGTEIAGKLEREFQAEYGLSKAVDYAHGRAARDEAERKMSPLTAAAIVQARAGNDSTLLPYSPTPSINPPRPRTLAAGYAADTDVLTVKFRDGAVYEYYDVPQNVWRNFQRVKSPGKAINRTLNQYAYARRFDLEG